MQRSLYAGSLPSLPKRRRRLLFLSSLRRLLFRLTIRLYFLCRRLFRLLNRCRLLRRRRLLRLRSLLFLPRFRLRLLLVCLLRLLLSPRLYLVNFILFFPMKTRGCFALTLKTRFFPRYFTRNRPLITLTGFQPLRKTCIFVLDLENAIHLPRHHRKTLRRVNLTDRKETSQLNSFFF